MPRFEPAALVRDALLRVGPRLGVVQLANLRSALSYLELGAWLSGLPGGSGSLVRVPRRVDLFARALTRVTGRRPLYLEFGVFEGNSMRWWAAKLTNPAAQFVGFDSFEGLPEDWRPSTPRGWFKTGGPPAIDDARVSFVTGWFSETLPGFDLPEHDQLIVNIDCDLYTSAATVLAWLEPHLQPGSLVYFDELPDRDHEMRALFESLRRSGREVRPLGIGRGGMHWLFEYL